MLVALLLSQSAAAGPIILAEGVTTLATLGDGARNLGSGIGVRVGMPIDVVLVELTPEVGVTVWSSDTLAVVPEVGARINVGKVAEPGAYAHICYLAVENGTVGWDAGLALDITVIPKIDFGAQAGVQVFDAKGALTAGLHVGVKL